MVTELECQHEWRSSADEDEVHGPWSFGTLTLSVSDVDDDHVSDLLVGCPSGLGSGEVRILSSRNGMTQKRFIEWEVRGIGPFKK